MTVPISIALYCVQKRRLHPLMLLLFMKSISSGHLFIDDKLRRRSCEALQWKDKRTYNKHMRWLLRHHWITMNNKNQSIRLVSFGQIHKMIGGRVLTGARMETDDLKEFKAFIYAALITYVMTAKKRIQNVSERKKGHSSKSTPYCRFKDLPIRYLAPILGVNHATVSRYKAAAEQAGYIRVHHRFMNLHKRAKFFHVMRRYCEPSLADSLTVRKGRVFARLPDLIFSDVPLVFLKRLKTG